MVGYLIYIGAKGSDHGQKQSISLEVVEVLSNEDEDDTNQMTSHTTNWRGEIPLPRGGERLAMIAISLPKQVKSIKDLRQGAKRGYALAQDPPIVAIAHSTREQVTTKNQSRGEDVHDETMIKATNAILKKAIGKATSKVGPDTTNESESENERVWFR